MQILADSRGHDTHSGLIGLALHVQRFRARQAAARSNNDAVVRSLRLRQWLAEDAHGSHLVNFPFAFFVSMILSMGLTAFGSGIIVRNAWLAGAGVVATLIASILYGWSLRDSD